MELGFVTWRQWAFNGFKGLVVDGVEYSAASTGVLAAVNSGVTFVLVGLAYEGGVVVGSAINAAFIDTH